MQLSTWLRSNGLSDAEFGARLDPPVSQVTVCRWRNGRRHPRPADVRRITVATGGDVTANDFMAALSEPKAMVSRRRRAADGFCAATAPA